MNIYVANLSFDVVSDHLYGCIAVVPAGQMPSPEMGANPADEMKGVYPRRPPSFAIRIGAAVRRKPFSRKEKQKWVIRGRKIKAKGNNRKRPSVV